PLYSAPLSDFSDTGDGRSAGGSLPTPCIGQGSSRGPATGPSNITVTTERRRALRACAMLYGLLAALCLIWGQLRQLPDERVLDLGSATGQLEIGQEGQNPLGDLLGRFERWM